MKSMSSIRQDGSPILHIGGYKPPYVDEGNQRKPDGKI
jgi:hypothetical protein